MSSELYFRNGEEIFGISYSVDLSSNGNKKSPKGPGHVIIPNTTMAISISIWLNGQHCEKREDIFPALKASLLRSKIWGNIMFSPVDSKLNANQDSMDDLQLFLKCNLFNPMLTELSQCGNIQYVDSLDIKFEYWSPRQTLYYCDLFDTLQYSLSSLFLNLEFKFPFVFSYYGKQLVKTNYKHIMMNMKLLLKTEFDSPDSIHDNILEVVLLKLHSGILEEFNTLNIMKECDLYRWRARSCRKFTEKQEHENSRRSIKSRAFDFRILNESYRLNYFAQDETR